MTAEELDGLRSEIDGVDVRIMDLLSRRLDLASEIGLTKRKDGLAVRDAAREDEVVERMVHLGRDRAVGDRVSRELARLLIESAVETQNGPGELPLAGFNALVVGGAGRMGEWVCRFLSNRGVAVKVWDPRRRIEGYEQVDSPTPHAADAHLVVIASPLGAASEDLRTVLDCGPKGIVFDLCSVKSHIAGILRESVAAGLKVTSVHPMFGPGIPTPRGFNVLVCSCGCDESDRLVRKLFGDAGAHVRSVVLEEHDGLMAYVLGLSHLTALLFGSALNASGRSVEVFRTVQGTSFDRLAVLAREVSLESRRVYHDIQSLNPNSKAMLEGVADALSELSEAALDRDATRFAEIMDRQRDYMEVF